MHDRESGSEPALEWRVFSLDCGWAGIARMKVRRNRAASPANDAKRARSAERHILMMTWTSERF
jgi:hypothetical protein